MERRAFIGALVGGSAAAGLGAAPSAAPSALPGSDFGKCSSAMPKMVQMSAEEQLRNWYVNHSAGYGRYEPMWILESLVREEYKKLVPERQQVHDSDILKILLDEPETRVKRARKRCRFDCFCPLRTNEDGYSPYAVLRGEPAASITIGAEETAKPLSIPDQILQFVRSSVADLLQAMGGSMTCPSVSVDMLDAVVLVIILTAHRLDPLPI